MNASLKGPFGQTSLESSPNPYTIGRAPDNQLVVNDARASSHHAQIRTNGQSYEIIDLASSNGTFVNEQQLAPNTLRLLASHDRIRIGDTTFVFEEAVASAQSALEATIYGGGPSNSAYPPNPAYPPTVAAQPPVYPVESYNAPQDAYAPPPYAPPPYSTNGYSAQPAGFGTNAPVQPVKSGRGKIWIIVGAIVGLIVIAVIAFGIIGYVNRSTTTKTLDAFCTALKGGDFPTAYSQLSSGLQAKYGSEAAFAKAYSNNGGLGKITDCSVSNVNDGANTGTISYVLSQGSANSIVVDYTLINENNALKINAQNPRSTPTLTLNNYCNALAQQDYQTAYNQLSSSAQSQETEAQFAANFSPVTVSSCKVSNVNDTAGTGVITYTLSNGNSGPLDYTLVNQSGTWKINSEKQPA